MAAGWTRLRKKVLIVALVASLVTVLAACNSNTIGNSNNNSNNNNNNNRNNDTSSPRPGSVGPMTVSIAVGSEDLAFFEDPQVKAEFKHGGLPPVTATPFGSGELANDLPSNGYDAFFPSSQVFADMAELRLHPHPEYIPFSTSLRVFTWKPLVPLLQENGLINKYGQFDIGQYLIMVKNGQTWSNLPGNNFYPNPSQVLLKMTDPAKSDSGAMFVAAASYVIYTKFQHHGTMTYGQDMVTAVSPEISGLLSSLGEGPPTTNDVYLYYRVHSGGCRVTAVCDTP